MRRSTIDEDLLKRKSRFPLAFRYKFFCKALSLVRIVEEHLLARQWFHVILLLLLVVEDFTIHQDAVSWGWLFIRIVFVILRAINVTSADVKFSLRRAAPGLSLRWLLLSLVLRLVDLAAELVWTVWTHDLVHGLAACWGEHATCRRATTSLLLQCQRFVKVQNTCNVQKAWLYLAGYFITVVSWRFKNGSFTPLSISQSTKAHGKIILVSVTPITTINSFFFTGTH